MAFEWFAQLDREEKPKRQVTNERHVLRPFQNLAERNYALVRLLRERADQKGIIYSDDFKELSQASDLLQANKVKFNLYHDKQEINNRFKQLYAYKRASSGLLLTQRYLSRYVGDLTANYSVWLDSPSSKSDEIYRTLPLSSPPAPIYLF